MSGEDESELQDLLWREKAWFIEVDAEHIRLIKSIEVLKERINSREHSEEHKVETVEKNSNQRTSQEKVSLFRKLFRGRIDVFPKRWENIRKSISGYSPACSNEWVKSVCEKPKIKCGQCPNQAFVPVTDHVIISHLQGRSILGIYPLLEDDSCYFLAIDFDKDAWRDDVEALQNTCNKLHVPCAIERSRSGNGAHVWFFFRSAVPAKIARDMGAYLITSTMQNYHQLSMSSYDRMFPNQDTLPRGGFGNLIALPFQHAPRQKGNTVFIDSGWMPYANQWDFLASHPRLELQQVSDLAKEAARKGLIIAAGFQESTEDEDNISPWLQATNENSQRVIQIENLPNTIKVTMAQLLFIEKAGLPAGLVNKIKLLAAFQNPEFYKKQSIRLSTAMTPRIISCSEDHPEHIGLPRGCLDNLRQLLNLYNIKLEIDDERCCGDNLKLQFEGHLSKVQHKAVSTLIQYDCGVFVAPPGSGKTVVGVHMIANRSCNTLVIVHRTQLLEQWIVQLSIFLGIDKKEIGQIGGGKNKPNGSVDVAMIQSLVQRDVVDDIVTKYGHVIVDECHHVSAVSFERVMRTVKARYILGLTATPYRRDGHQPILKFQLGPIRYSIDPRSQIEKRTFEHKLILRKTNFTPADGVEKITIQEMYSSLIIDENRNTMILDDIIQALENGRSPILLTERREHLDYFTEKLRGVARNLIILRGGMRKKEREIVAEQFNSIPDSEERLVLATGRFIGEGFDDARLDTLFLTMPVSWKGTLVQYAGRLHRQHHAKTEVQIFDYVDGKVPMLTRMFKKRMRGYRAMGYASSSDSISENQQKDYHNRNELF